jgi:hypothetical protein
MLEEELNFYSNTLRFQITEKNFNSFAVRIGWSELTFEKSEKERIYHYCFLIPSNMLKQALEWMEERTEIVEIENGRKTQYFETWNAESFYFYDASGNIVELIARYDMKNESNADFNISKILCVNEIGMPTNKIHQLNNQLKSEINTDFWKGDLLRFGTNGDEEGILLLPNYEVKDIWFPTHQKTNPEPFEAIIENAGKEYEIEFREGKLKTTVIE